MDFIIKAREQRFEKAREHGITCYYSPHDGEHYELGEWKAWQTRRGYTVAQLHNDRYMNHTHEVPAENVIEVILEKYNKSIDI